MHADTVRAVCHYMSPDWKWPPTRPCHSLLATVHEDLQQLQCLDVDIRVSTLPGKSWIFCCIISRPWKVLENGFGPGKSWNFLLGYDVGGRHNGVGVGADAKIQFWQVFRQFVCCFSVTMINIYLNMDAVIIRCIYMRLVTSVCLYLHVAGVWESPEFMFLGYWKVLEKSWKLFWTKECEPCDITGCWSGTLVGT